MKLAFIGIGKVGYALANGLQGKGHEIIIAHDDVASSSVQQALSQNPAFEVATLQQAIHQADVIFLAVPFMVAEEVLAPLNFGGKILVDCTNPVGPGIRHGLQSTTSGTEQIMKWAGDAQVVKSYTIYGFENLENPDFSHTGVQPAMLIAGDDPSAKAMVTQLNTDLGFETVDVGDSSRALHLEHMTLLWVNMVRAQGHHPHFTWGYLERSPATS